MKFTTTENKNYRIGIGIKMYSRDVNLFWELLELSDSVLVLDNDMCMLTYNEEEHQAFDFGPKDLVEIMAAKLDIEVDHV